MKRITEDRLSKQVMKWVRQLKIGKLDTKNIMGGEH